VGVPQGRLGALEERPFRLLWLGQTLSAIGDAFVPVALAFAVLSELHGSASDLGLVLASSILAQVVLMLAGGVWADRLPRRTVMIGADLVRAGLNGFLGVVLIAGHGELWQLVAVAALSGAATAFFNPASSGLIPETISPARLQQANALIGVSRGTTRIFAPAVSGLLVAGFGAGWAFALNSVSFVASVVSLAALPLAAAVRRGREPFLRELADGWHEVRSRTWVWTALLCFSLSNIAVASYFVLGPLVVSEELGGAAAWGVVLSGGAVGTLLGGIVAIRFRPRYPLRWAFAPIVFCALQLLTLVPPLPVPGLVVAALLAVAGIELSNALWSTVLQERIPRHALSRVSAYDYMVSFVFMPVGYALAGPLADAIGVDTTLILAAALAAGSNLAMLLIPSVRNLPRLVDEVEVAAERSRSRTPVPA
jgi:MFS family permease